MPCPHLPDQRSRYTLRALEFGLQRKFGEGGVCMAKLVVVVGMPGSGKSYYIRALERHFPGVCVDDYMANSHGNSPRFTDSRWYAQLVRALREGRDSLIADIEYCDTWRRVEVEEVIRFDVPGVEIEWRFFENDPARCEANVVQRNRASVAEETRKIRDLSRKYQIPPGAAVIPVWTGPLGSNTSPNPALPPTAGAGDGSMG